MINCPACGLRHRSALSQCHVRGEIRYVKIAEGKTIRGIANGAGWRAKPGKLFWIPELKQFMTIDKKGLKDALRNQEA